MITRYKLESVYWVPAALREVWDFATLAKSQSLLYPAVLGAKGPGTDRIIEGSNLDLRLSLVPLGPALEWKTRIIEMSQSEQSGFVVEVQEYGPFNYWMCRHSFDADPSVVNASRNETQMKASYPGTWVKDRLEYSLPMGILGKGVNELFLKQALSKLLAFRKKAIQIQFGMHELGSIKKTLASASN